MRTDLTRYHAALMASHRCSQDDGYRQWLEIRDCVTGAWLGQWNYEYAQSGETSPTNETVVIEVDVLAAGVVAAMRRFNHWLHAGLDRSWLVSQVDQE